LNRTERIGLPGHDSDIRRAVDKGRATRTGQPGQESQDRTAGIGHLGEDNWDRTPGTKHLGQESQDRRAGTEQQEKTVVDVQLG
jgi:hypothetical protein